MSHTSNQELIETAQEAIELGQQYIIQCEDYFLGTNMAAILDMCVANCVAHIAENNLEDLFHFSLPALNKRLIECAIELGRQAQEEIYGIGDLSEQHGMGLL